jgi:phosphatidyl-myo-inositol alpha-mannosyltransferase
MWVVMACPYSLSKPGGVQGQTLGLARSLRALGHTVTVLAPHDNYLPGTFLTDSPEGWPRPIAPLRGVPSVPLSPFDGTITVGPSIGVRANGSVAPVALAPRAMLRVVQFLRDQSLDVIHLHEPLAPMMNYAFLLWSAVPIVGTFHRSGHSAWHRALSPVAKWASSRLSVRCAVSTTAAETTPALYGESFGVVLLEAMAVHCTVVASALDGHRAASGGHAHLFAVGEKRALANSLVDALGDADAFTPERRDALDRALTYANERSMEHLARRYEAIYVGACG